MDNPPFGRWLKQTRKAHGLTQQALADRLGYHVSLIRKVEAGVRHPSAAFLERLSALVPLPAHVATMHRPQK